MIKLGFICDLAAFTACATVSPPLSYQMCLAQFGMRHTQINIQLRGATVESPRWVSKKNILSFICIARSPLMTALMLLCVLALHPHTRLRPWYNVPKSSFSISGKEWDRIFGTSLIQTSEVHEVFVLNRRPFHTKHEWVHIHAVSCAETPHTHTQWWYEPETISIRSSCSSILPNPFISCLSSQILLFSLASYTYTARQPHFFYTIFPPPSAALIIYGACNEPAVDFSYYWLLQLKLLTEAGKMLLPSPPLLRHDSKILHNSVLVITHPSKFPQALSVNYGITATPSPLLPIQL